MLYHCLLEIRVKVDQKEVKLNKDYVIYQIENSKIKNLLDIFKS